MQNGVDQVSASDPCAQLGAELAAADERERRSRELADLVLQRLFGLAASLAALSSSTSDERAAQRLRACVDDLDRTIDAIRDGVLQQTPLGEQPLEALRCPPIARAALAEASLTE